MKRIVLQTRDKELIQFLKDFKCATTSTLTKMFFKGSSRVAQRRLKALGEHGYIKSYQENVITDKVHYVRKKPTQLKHSLILSDFIGELRSHGIDIIKYKCPLKISNVIADCFIAIRYNDKNHIFFIEVENTKSFDCKKYEDLYYSRKYKESFPVMPNIIVISDRKITKSNNFKVIGIDTEFKKIDNLLKNI